MEDKKQGMYWHCHHDELVEYVWDYDERVDYIKNKKPKNEIKTRLKLFKKVKGKLPVEFLEVREKYVEAWEKYVEAGNKYREAWDKYQEAKEKYQEAKEKYWEAEEKYKPQIEKLHKKECGCKEWNGVKIVFKVIV